MAHYVSVAEAIPMRGLRLVLTRGVPGPWGEAAKAILHVKKIPYVKVAQVVGENDEALTRWTGAANAGKWCCAGKPHLKMEGCWSKKDMGRISVNHKEDEAGN